MSSGMDSYDVLIVGAGQAATTAAATLRQCKFAGSVAIVGDEALIPYQRPPLSKGYLKGEVPAERLWLKPESWYSDQEVTLMIGATAVAIDRDGKSVDLADGRTLGYDRLIIATGAEPIALPLPGAELAGVHLLRSVADIDRMQPAASSGATVTIVGAGYIGLEAAAALKTMGLEVRVLERAHRILQRVTSSILSDYFRQLHTGHGVDIQENVRVSGFDGLDGSVSAVQIEGRDALASDFVLVGVGVRPRLAVAEAAGIECGNGIIVDRECRTSDADVYAIGDCAEREISPYGYRGRLESVHNAIEQGKRAALSIAGRPAPPPECPWFWSDQFDTKLQIAGLSTGHDGVVVRGSTDERSFAVFYLRDERLIAVDAINSPREFAGSKALIMAGERIERSILADPVAALPKPVGT